MTIRTFATAAAVAAALLAGSAQADVLYSNGSSAYDFSAWTLGIGYSVSNSFTLASVSSIDLFTFDTWNKPIDSIVHTVNWSISSTPFGAAISGEDNALLSIVATLQFDNGLGYKTERNVVEITPFALAAGTYWLNLGNAVTNDGQPAFWDINNGPSSAWHSTLGDLTNGGCESYFGIDATCSSTFSIQGTARPVPEPASWAMMIAGFGMVGFAMRRRAVAVTA
jgi:hypothetical protein